MDALVAAGKKEGTLNVIALPRDWANYGAIIEGFTAKYGIKIEDENPDGSSQDEINAVKTRKGQDRAPDVLDLGQLLRAQRPPAGPVRPVQGGGVGQDPRRRRRTPTARWYNDYGGYVSIGCDAKRSRTARPTFADLLKPEYKGKVALNGNPTKSGSAFARRVRGGAGQRRLLRRHPARHRLLRRS